MFKFSAEEIRKLLKGIFDGSITDHELPEYLYNSIADFLKDGLYSGFGISFNKLTEEINKGIGKFVEKDLELLTELRENIYMFSAAKTYTEVKDMSDLLTGENGITSFPEFKAAAMEIYTQYNEDYLQTEYQTSIAQSQQAIKWNQIEAQKEILPYLQFSVVEDANTTDICQPLDGIVVKVGDPMLDIYYPPNHWNCRTILEQLDEATLSSKSEVEKATKEADDEMQDIFKMNSGKDKVVFKDDHPYFDVAKKDQKFAENNFNLKIPDED
jgi:SPP1 gp7 family putative phage head morphogenesis protein